MSEPLVNRRSFLATCGAAIPVLAWACRSDGGSSITDPFVSEPGRLRLLPRGPSRSSATGNDVLLGEGLRRAYIRVPPHYSAKKPAPLVILFHGSGGRGDIILAAFASRLDAMGAIGLAPDAVGITWDMFDVGTLFAADIPFVNDVLDQTFDRCAIDTHRISLLGFSDGASYALTVGIANGDQLDGIVACSAGTYSVENPHGSPAIFTSHGSDDPLFPADNAAAMDAQLTARGCSVTHVEFSGGHEVPDTVADQAFAWLSARG